MKIAQTIVAAALMTLSMSATAQNVEPINKDKVAIGGYDVVAYLTNNAATTGKKEFTQEFKGVKYRFASAENRKLFRTSPEKYLPQLDGYCAWGVAEKGVKFPVNPETFKVVDGKLYLFFNGDFNGTPFNTLSEWNKDEAHLLAQLSEKWKELNK
jgi:YHS domain-containing protein